MRQPGLDLEDVFKRVRASVEAATRAKQTPWEESSLKGDFYFVPKRSSVAATPLQTPPAFDTRALELAFWNSIAERANPADFEAYLARYPDGVFIDLARTRLRGLKNRQEVPPAQRRTGGRFDGKWQGQGMLIAGASPCPPLINFRLEISGDRITGSAKSPGENYQVEGDLVGQNKIEGRFFNALGLGTFETRNDNGEWRGSWEAEGECDGSIQLAQTR